jgi:hypothetical protein
MFLPLAGASDTSMKTLTTRPSIRLGNAMACFLLACAALGLTTDAAALPPPPPAVYANGPAEARFMPSDAAADPTGLLRYESRPTPELACREVIAPRFLDMLRSAHLDVKLIDASVSGHSPKFQCDYTFEVSNPELPDRLTQTSSLPISETHECPIFSEGVAGSCQCMLGYEENATQTACEPSHLLKGFNHPPPASLEELRAPERTGP